MDGEAAWKYWNGIQTQEYGNHCGLLKSKIIK
jgi:hypothetical protein